jgi:hypothetical protein
VLPSESIRIADPVESIRSSISRIKGKSIDFFVVLTQQGLDEDMRLAEALPGLNLILGGNNQDSLGNPAMTGKTAIFSSEDKGKRITKITINWSKSSVISHEVIEMDKSIGDDPGVRAMIETYNARVVHLFKLDKHDDENLRAEACSGCHAREYDKWRRTDHASAYESLVSVNREFDPDCLKCHTTRFDAPGGFSMRDQQKGLRHVQCEACHGSAGEHAAHPLQTKLVGKITQSACAGCHTREQSPAFSDTYGEYRERVKCR